MRNPARGREPGMTGREVAKLIDHTLLRADATERQIEGLCREAAEFKFATVCVNPIWVPMATRLLAGSGVGVCTVVGFPLGASRPDAKAYEARRALADGARELDMVISIGLLKSGEVDEMRRDIEAIVGACRVSGAVSKIIIEAVLLTDGEKVAACKAARTAGADFVKTSTGFGPGGATIADVALIRRTIGPEMGIKAAGGIRDLATVKAMIAAGATRIGTSASLAIIRETAGA